MTNQSNTSRQGPATMAGRWAVGLGIAFVVLFLINSLVFMPLAQIPANARWTQTLLPYYGIFMLLVGLASGVYGAIAVFRKHERSWMVWLTLLPAAFVLFLLLGEFLIPH